MTIRLLDKASLLCLFLTNGKLLPRKAHSPCFGRPASQETEIPRRMKIKCEYCNGSGHLEKLRNRYGAPRCMVCEGTGEIEKPDVVVCRPTAVKSEPPASVRPKGHFLEFCKKLFGVKQLDSSKLDASREVVSVVTNKVATSEFDAEEMKQVMKIQAQHRLHGNRVAERENHPSTLKPPAEASFAKIHSQVHSKLPFVGPAAAAAVLQRNMLIQQNRAIESQLNELNENLDQASEPPDCSL